MQLLKKITIKHVLCLYIILCPILDILSFAFRNYFNTNISISTFLRPIIPVMVSIYIFIKANKKNKCILGATAGIYALYAFLHLFVASDFFTGCSYGGFTKELQYIINFTFLIVNLINFYYAFIKNKWRKDENVTNEQTNNLKLTNNIKVAILIMCLIYMASIYLAILTKTSSYTYKGEQIGYKGWIESGNSLSAILCLSIFVILDLIKDKKYRIWAVIAIISTGIFLVALIGTRTGLIGFFLGLAIFITLEVFFSKNKVAIIGFVIIAVGVIGIGLVGSNTLIRRKQMNEAMYTIIDEKTGEVGHMTGDMLRIKNKILDGTLEEGYMSDAQKQAVLDLNEYAEKVNLPGNETRVQQLMYNIFLVKNQKSMLGIIFGNGYETNFREMVMENELASLILNFGIIGFVLYPGPFVLILIKSIIVILKKLKNKEKIKTGFLMNVAALGLAFVLSYLTGYIFFNSSVMIILAGISVEILRVISEEKENTMK